MNVVAVMSGKESQEYIGRSRGLIGPETDSNFFCRSSITTRQQWEYHFAQEPLADKDDAIA
jgi:hypothetical protein